ncbi:FAD-dependent monooxygenase [Phanerochaete sordida]|uniref:FAD-dependent monooxygenase n=1 Tax=Phanerochaete sordida TaxID=48140 RepID=A0A9P3LG33_9APHY|nr:FAD-dependent monooxygenase [Phanerochaete sordida]
MANDHKFHIAIVGGGIVGLTFAIALHKSGAPVDVDIYEAAPAFGEVGAGMAFLPRMWDAMRVLGLEEQLRPKTGAGKPFRFSKAIEGPLTVFGENEEAMDSYHRAEVLSLLTSNLPKEYRTHFGKRLVAYIDAPGQPVQLHFKDGTTATCDLLVGSDGIKSSVRGELYEQLAARVEGDDPARAQQLREYIPAKWTGIHMFRGLVPREKLEAACPDHPVFDGPVFMQGKGKYLLTYPISQGTIINCSGIINNPEGLGKLHPEPWVVYPTHEEFHEAYAGFSPYVHTVIDLIEKPTKWVANSVMGLPTFVDGRVALVGDAAHAMTPHLASGAGQGVEDGLVLAALLASPHARPDTLPAVLRAYDAVRRPFSQDILKRSYDAGTMLCLMSERTAGGKTGAADLAGLNADLNDITRWAWTTSSQVERDAALKLLAEYVGEK